MIDPYSALSGLFAIKGVAWVGLKAADVLAQTATDGNIKNQLAMYRKSASTWLRGTGVRYGVFGDTPQAAPTNHDLLRALRAAWIRVAQQKLSRIRELQRAFEGTAEFRDWPNLALMTDSFAEELRRLEMEAENRNASFFVASPVENMLLTVVDAVPEQIQGLSGEADDDILTPAFVDGILSLPVDWGTLQSRVREILSEELISSTQGRSLRPGEAILDRFVENLKSGQFPQAAQAFQFLVGGLIRQDVAAAAGEVRGDLAELQETISALRDDLAAGAAPAVLDALQIEIVRSRDEISDGIARVDRDLQRLEAIVGARDHDFIVTRDEVAERRRRLTTTFYGRHEELDRLFKRLNERKNSLTIITAPAGTGKSGFMARAIGAADARGFAVAFHFINREHQRTFEPDDALGFIALQLRALGDGEGDDRRLDRDVKSLQDEIYRRLQADYSAARPLVIFIDGLDELHGRLPFFVPATQLGANVHVVVSCRTSSQEDVPPVLRDWIGSGAARAFGMEAEDLRIPLAPLGRTEIALWLRHELGSIALFDPLPLAKRLEATSDGLAVFLRYLVDDVRKAIQGGQSPDRIQRDLAGLPAPFASYLEAVLDGERDGTPIYGPSERRFLAVLSVAHGPIAQAELQALCQGIDVRYPQDSVRRWLAPVSLHEGPGWALQHPRLSAPFTEALDYEAEDARVALSDHCVKAIETLPPRNRAYAARWGVTHLLGSGERDAIEQLTSRLVDPSFIAWRLETVPTKQILGLIQDNYDALLRVETGEARHDLERWSRLFASLVPALSKEARS